METKPIRRFRTSEAFQWGHRESFFLLAVTLCSMVANYAFFGDLCVNAGFLFWNFIVIALFLVCFHVFRKLTLLPNARYFQFVVFFLSLAIRTLIMFFLYFLFYEITGTAFDVEATDAFTYHAQGLELARQLGEMKFNLYGLTGSWGYHFDDMGYPVFLGLTYGISDNSIIFARLVQCTVDSFSVLLIYKISRSVWNENTARSAAILAMIFPLQILYVALHLKETLMVFCLFVGIYGTYRFSERMSPKALLLIMTGAIGLASMRTAMLVIFAAAVMIFYVFTKWKTPLYKATATVLVFISFVALLNVFGIDKQVYSKSLKFVGVEEGGLSAGGRSIETYKRRGQSVAGILLLPLMGMQMLISPYPSMVRTNVKFFNQTMQWYQIGPLFIWGYLGFFGLYGFYHSIRFNFTRSLLLSSFLIGYGIALLISVYVMSIRYNFVKIIFFIPFIALGMSRFPQVRIRWWYIYCCLYAIVVFLWNFLKLYGRGYV